MIRIRKTLFFMICLRAAVLVHGMRGHGTCCLWMRTIRLRAARSLLTRQLGRFLIAFTLSFPTDLKFKSYFVTSPKTLKTILGAAPEQAERPLGHSTLEKFAEVDLSRLRASTACFSSVAGSALADGLPGHPMCGRNGVNLSERGGAIFQTWRKPLCA